MTKTANSERYFIAIPTSFGGPEHMTIKFLGNLTQAQVNKVKIKLDQLASVEKVPLVSGGVGVLGRKSTFIVDFVADKDIRLQSIFKPFNKSMKNIVPHVTAFKIKPKDTNTVNTGAITPMSSVLAEKIVLYKTSKPYKYIPVHEVYLKKRTPWNWIKDRFANWL
jgi:2'-5' RNA ligase